MCIMDTGFDFGSLLLDILIVVPGAFRGAASTPDADLGPAAAEIAGPPKAQCWSCLHDTG